MAAVIQVDAVMARTVIHDGKQHPLAESGNRHDPEQ
jgi:hypothetical protein